MFKGINETVFKVVIILLMCIFLVALGFTAYEFYRGDYTQEKLFWHKFMGVMLILIMPIHMIIKKNKIKKLYQEFVNILLKKEIKHTNNKEELVENIKKKSLNEIADIFNIDIERMKDFLQKNHILIKGEDETLSKIAKKNSKDIYQLLILILRLHVESSSPVEG